MKFDAFSVRGGELSDYLSERLSSMREIVEKETENDLLNVSEEQYVNYLIGQATVEPPIIHFDQVCFEEYETTVKQKLDQQLARAYGKSEVDRRANAFKFMIPYMGNIALIKYLPNQRYPRSEEVFIEDGYLCFEVLDMNNDAAAVNREQLSITSFLQNSTAFMTGQVQTHNNGLRQAAEQFFRERKSRILKRLDLRASITVPLRKRTDVPSTFAIPIPIFQRSIAISKPMVTEKGYKPEPTLDQDTYHEILQVIHDVGKQLERTPALYKLMGEETIRDHILGYLVPRYGAATGESFNKTGKTDILIRYQNQNIFVAECKFWGGAQKYLETIDQLLGYLTWRDSKAAVVLLVRNKDLSGVLATIKKTTPEHSNFLGFVSEKEDTWFNYRLHIHGDKNREIKVAVLVFHLPPAVGTSEEQELTSEF